MYVNLYTRTVCPLCEKAKDQLLKLAQQFPLVINEIDIYQNDRLLEKYHLMIPVVEIDGKEIDYGMIDVETIRRYLLERDDEFVEH
ncbi:glutaredoxin family protein [Bacillus sp. P2(2020)]|uniref:Glutaredoxin family protein n=1 Tax=Calidifontibacillus erzurumensis TaxID=2741433 RepID=A0A8J8GIX8_9BACI|nr:glutaredoxin family protein [Calidifontibacillus erzurumensis]